MLNLVEKMLPFESEPWENLAACYNLHLGADIPQRDGDSLSKRFKKLYRIPTTSGNGKCPPHISRAKRLKRMFESAILVTTLHSDEERSDDEVDVGDDTIDVAGVDSEVDVQHDATHGVSRILCVTTPSSWYGI
ncbi:hypothetical protein GN244_ATG03868 [Phytophthora infestans]|uniref:DUF6818 domain-containing protein n=1 Tax=Phytophthora infestans TaxID=4787 RepID=A0A833TNW5_PHYIN|nr:hypothetical protein GN244_ATG03868 [Phytophthora infestans]